MLKMNNAFILIFGSTPLPASYLAPKRDAVKFPKSVYSFSGASPVACQKNFEKNKIKHPRKLRTHGENENAVEILKDKLRKSTRTGG